MDGRAALQAGAAGVDAGVRNIPVPCVNRDCKHVAGISTILERPSLEHVPRAARLDALALGVGAGT